MGVPSTRGLDERALLAMRASALAEAFRAAPAAPAASLPDGRADGVFLWGGGTVLARPTAAAVRLVWRGKVVDNGRGRVVNRVTPLGLRLVQAAVGPGPSRVDGRECVVLDYSRTSLVARLVRDELRPVAPGLYLGAAWLWRWRFAWFTLRFPG
ncbi:hypothetical protein [Motilibacter aurantiacus]|uniref:hypothetical protein n=1 Tax=Motilibacter aurantiacus TaxID=2714955 RepID=UPI00140AD8BF|nr:hypothetical protein [Motilibacter aurantiacus]NHC47449.1 hypothetical protein [Motilibacter aurantiacus]